jgi:aspartyl-tRNA(Asn)/glutamyl-tRNA(Gln) amidotransferase subunit B
VAKAYVATLRDLLRALGVSDVRMEQGSLRCDVNVSLRPSPDAPFGTRTETKNVNSLRSVERAVRYEIGRQAALLDRRGRIVQETRHWHEDTGITTPGRRSPTPRTTATSPSPTWCRSRRRGVGRGAARDAAGASGVHRARLQAEWGFSDLEMRDVVNAGALDLVEATSPPAPTPPPPASGGPASSPAAPTRAGVELADLPITPARSPGSRRSCDEGRSTTSWPAR